MIRRLLVANRGEIARRIFATCRTMGIGTVAVYSDPDADAPQVAEADRAVRLPGAAAADTYLRADLIVAAARAAGADAVHPGYGFLAENAEFAEAVLDAGLTWVGPPAKAIATMGSKLEAKRMLADAGVPMLPTYPDPERVAEFPVLLKASAGGGGRGMRVVHDAGDLATALASARREAAAAFGDGTVFAEPYLEHARHVEVQIVADGHGTVRALGERECSVQRRHQKIVEESPSPAVGPDLRDRLCAAAVAAARAVGYVGAGTVEFLLAPGGTFHFLEMNTRLQVEHPVTESVTGLDLVRLQLLVADGQPLPDPLPEPTGHAVEARLYAEDPAHDWRPGSGTLHRFAVPDATVEFGVPAGGPGSPGVPGGKPVAGRGAGVRLDAGVVDGSTVSTHYDPMLAKLIGYAPTRAEAVRALAGALRRARLHGPVTNRDLLVRVLDHPAFLAGDTDTGFLSRYPEVFAPLVDAAGTGWACLAAALAEAAGRRASAPVLRAVPSGWRNVGPGTQAVGYRTPAGPAHVTYAFGRDGGLVAWSVEVDGGTPCAGAGLRLVSAAPDLVVLERDGVRTAYHVARSGRVSYVDGPDGSVTVTRVPRFAEPGAAEAEGSLTAPMPGTVGRVLVEPGQPVAAGELLLTLEAMKLEHPVRATAAGVVEVVPVAAGTQVDTGTVLVVITPEGR